MFIPATIEEVFTALDTDQGHQQLRSIDKSNFILSMATPVRVIFWRGDVRIYFQSITWEVMFGFELSASLFDKYNYCIYINCNYNNI
ncbi:MAG: hypothetical protein WD607_01400, partial [Candidatus Paceibacterota bacterium]